MSITYTAQMRYDFSTWKNFIMDQRQIRIVEKCSSKTHLETSDLQILSFMARNSMVINKTFNLVQLS